MLLSRGGAVRRIFSLVTFGSAHNYPSKRDETYGGGQAYQLVLSHGILSTGT